MSLAHNARPHIPGAMMLDLDAIARSDDFPDDRDIVLYCSCPNEESARRGAQLLMRKGYRRVRPLVGGIDAWSAAGHPIEHGKTMMFVRSERPPPAQRPETIACNSVGRILHDRSGLKRLLANRCHVRWHDCGARRTNA